MKAILVFLCFVVAVGCSVRMVGIVETEDAITTPLAINQNAMRDGNEDPVFIPTPAPTPVVPNW